MSGELEGATDRLSATEIADRAPGVAGPAEHSLQSGAHEDPGDYAGSASPRESRSSASDPFRLRPRPPQVIRLSRKAIASLGLFLGLAVGGALIWALKSSSPRAATNLYDTASAAKPNVISGAPSDYSKVPRLGAMLPGDLGKPFLSAQARGTIAPGQEGQSPGSEARSQDDHLTPLQAAALERRQKLVQEGDAARSSQLFLGNGGGKVSGGTLSQADSGASATGAGALVKVTSATSAAPAAGSQASKRSFLESRSSGAFVSSESVTTTSSPYVLQAGSIIPAALITGIRSDLPGQITAQVTQNVYDSPTGRILLIPQGARLIGEYDSEVASGQNRVLLAWDRLILPDGRSIRLERQPGADASGMAGLQDKTNYHWGNMLKAALVSTLLGAGTQLVTQDDTALMQALRYGMQDTINQTGRQLVQRELNVAPTLTVRPGFPLRVVVTRDIIFDSATNMEK
jgi:type IV secretion system protein TrbI